MIFNLSPFTFQNIVICNAGLALKLSQEDVIQTFSAYGTIESVIMMPDKTYCFMSFFDKADAITAYESLHGKCFFPRTENLMVLAFAAQGKCYQNSFFHKMKTVK